MQNHTTRSREIDRGDARAAAMMHGYRDAKRGAPYNYRWDDLGLAPGAAYQNGRMLATELQRAGYSLPGWPTPQVFPTSLKKMRSMFAATDCERDIAPAFMFAGDVGKRIRPRHLIDADLRNSLIAAGLDALAPEATIEFY